MLERNAYFDHSENITVRMIGSSEEEIRHLDVETVLSLRVVDAGTIIISMRKFTVPKLNLNAQLF